MLQFITHIFDRCSGKVLLGQKRSSKWRKARKEYLKEHPTCECCGSKKRLEVHHIVPFSLDSSLELIESNLITLCRKHHCFVGHLMSWLSFNKDVKTDSKVWLQKIGNRP